MSQNNLISLESNTPPPGMGGDPWEQKTHEPNLNIDLGENPSDLFAPGPKDPFVQREGSDGSGKSVIRAILDKPLPDSILAELADRTGDPKAAAAIANELDERREEAAARAFRKANPTYVKSDANYNYLREYLEEHELDMTAANLEAAYTYGIENGELPDLPAGSSKSLTASELLTVQRRAQMGQAGVEEALSLYLKFSLPGFTNEDLLAALSDPAYRELTDEACMMVFAISTPDFPNTEEAAAAILDWAAGRPLNIGLCRTAWEHVKADALAAENAPEPINVDDLSDSEVREAMRGVSHLHAQR